MTNFSQASGKPTLPPNFAMKIIEKEIELEKSWSHTIIGELVEFYSQAIEFYNYNNDPKCYDYQDRMHKMLLKPQVMSSLSNSNSTHSRGKSEPLKLAASPPKPRPEPEKPRKIINPEFQNSLLANSHKAERNIARTIDEHENVSKEVSVQLADNFKKQDYDLMSRLESRRQLNRTFNAEQVQFENPANLSYSNAMDLVESDRSGGYSISKAELNRKIEELMEKHFAEKAAKIAEINVKYEKEIIEMQEEGVMALVVAQMRQNMKEEIETASKEFDARRRAEILKMRLEFQ